MKVGLHIGKFDWEKSENISNKLIEIIQTA